jgi:hypothetical protein
MLVLDEILENYFLTHKELIATEQVDDNSVIVSFPLHFVGNHRVEVSIAEVDGILLISDIGRTISELKDYGYSVSPGLLSRMVEIAKPANVRIIDNNLVMDCRPEQIGASLHSFAEAAKTIGDAYLAFHLKTPPEKKLLEVVGQLLNESAIPYKTSHKIRGKIDAHSVDFYVPPNGHPGLALEVLGGYNTHTTAQIWHFKCQDIRSFDDRMKVGIVYDIEDSSWSQKSEAILRDVADFALASSDLIRLPSVVKSTVS